jgi:hypothetical protein
VKPHDLDAVSLLAGTVFLVIGGVGLLQAAGAVGSGAPWAVIAAIAAVGLTATIVSLRGLVRTPSAATATPAPAPPPGPEDEDGDSPDIDVVDTDFVDDDTAVDTAVDDGIGDELDDLLADE